MADFTSDIGKGRVGYYSTLPAANDAFILIALKASGIVSDSTLKTYSDIATLLAGATDEATNTGYARKTITSITVTVDTTNHWQNLDTADQTWSAVGVTGGAWAKLVMAYDPDTTGGTDSSLIPLLFFDFSVTPDGSSDITAVFNASGIYRAS